jgi:ribonuclease T2
VNGTDVDLWEHEWSKHGTCMSTLVPSCYSHYEPHLELIHFYLTNFKMYRKLPTFHFLRECGIVPTNATTYTLGLVERCLADATGGFLPHLGCNKDGYLNEVWYYFHLRGRVRDGDFEGTNSTFKSTCPSSGIKYPPKLKTHEDSSHTDEVEATDMDGTDTSWFIEQFAKQRVSSLILV